MAAASLPGGGLEGGGCISRVNPPDPPGMGDKSSQVSSFQTLSRHTALLPFPEPLGSPCSFSVSPPPQPLPLLPLIPLPHSGHQQTAAIDFPGSAKPGGEGSASRGVVARAMAVLSRPRASAGRGVRGALSPSPRALPALCLVFWETWAALFPRPVPQAALVHAMWWWGNAAPPMGSFWRPFGGEAGIPLPSPLWG